jgi:hypothetical protein
MAWLGICYEGPDSGFLITMVEKHKSWLQGDRVPRMYGNSFMVIYDSNTARELVKKIEYDLSKGRILVYTIPSILKDVKK